MADTDIYYDDSQQLFYQYGGAKLTSDLLQAVGVEYRQHYLRNNDSVSHRYP